jgi:hypothetical protein
MRDEHVWSVCLFGISFIDVCMYDSVFISLCFFLFLGGDLVMVTGSKKCCAFHFPGMDMHHSRPSGLQIVFSGILSLRPAAGESIGLNSYHMPPTMHSFALQ